MALTVAQILQDIRVALGDLSASTWTDAELVSHLRRALGEYSSVAPRQRITTIATTTDVWKVSIATLERLVRVVRVEWPIDANPPVWVPHEVFGDVLSFDSSKSPNGDNLRVYWESEHDLDGDLVSVPERHASLLVDGAAGYAAQEKASSTTNTVNVDPTAVERYVLLAKERLERFRAELGRLVAAAPRAVDPKLVAQWRALATERLAAFRAELRRAGRRLRVVTSFTDEPLGRDRTVDWGP